jgi:1-aminocyclopropane-1-carboxylate deaminase/D-cysteine desulfhydrase-like pyridoxal-dependent ACC family enzyme
VFGRYPTDVQRLERLGSRTTELWVKRDDLTHAIYGGNKVRKLEHILPAALSRGARRLVTMGAAGSHHVLATTLHGARAGLGVAALLTAQPASEHVEQNLRVAIAHGLDAYPAPDLLSLPLIAARIKKRGDFFVPPGGSSVTGAVGYFDAARELLDQVEQGVAPLPDVIVVALGSGGTAAGLLAGLVTFGYEGTLLAVRVAPRWACGALPTLGLATAVSRRADPHRTRAKLATLTRVLRVTGEYLGRGYGVATTAGEKATMLAGEQGLVLEPTYTAKAFAAALDRVNEGGFKRVLFWHTLSSAPLQPLLARAPKLSDLPTALRALLVRPDPTS